MVSMIFILADGTQLRGANYCSVSDAGGDFRGDAWQELKSAAREAGLRSVELKSVLLELSEPRAFDIDE